jgi:hypothetical protein
LYSGTVESHNAIHKYWARKPRNVVSACIQRYSKPGEIVLDPFGGSGITAIEAIKAGRKAVSIDLNPMSAFLIENTISRLGAEEIEEAFRTIECKIKDKINALYETKCPQCGKQAVVLAAVCDRDTATPLELRSLCPQCNKYAAKPKSTDLDLLARIGKLRPKRHPNRKLAYNGNAFIKREGKETIVDLFSKRNFYALLMLFDEVKKIVSGHGFL